MGPLKVTIATGAWKRPKLFEYFCRYYASLKAFYPFELVISCSEILAFKTAKRYGHTAIMIDNKPLYKKMNASAGRIKNSDYIILIGSDDFLTPGFLFFYDSLFKKKIDYIYPLDWYFFDTISKKGLYWAGYNKKWNQGNACGAGRAVSRSLMEKLNWEPWIPGYDHVLDTGMEIKMRGLSYSKHGFFLKDEKVFALDIKTAHNMTPFQVWDNSFLVDGPELLKTNMPTEAQKILSL